MPLDILQPSVESTSAQPAFMLEAELNPGSVVPSTCPPLGSLYKRLSGSGLECASNFPMKENIELYKETGMTGEHE